MSILDGTILRRWKDARAIIKPLRIKLKNQEEKVLDIYTKKVGAKIYGRENKSLYEKLISKVGMD